MSETNPLDDIVDELVVFKHEDPNHHDGQYFSNNPMWADSRVREHWMKRNSDEAKAAQNDVEDDEDDEDEDSEEVDYNVMTNEDLRAELLTRGLALDGKKVDLIQRLEEDDATEENDATGEK
jgi:hypothetical protein